MSWNDKALLPFLGKPLIAHVLDRLRSQTASFALACVAINANRNLDAYEAYRIPVWPDHEKCYSGPLAGFVAGLRRCETPFLLTVPCDAPFIPLDLLDRLGQALLMSSAEIAMAVAPDNTGDLRLQPVFALLRVSTLTSLLDYLQQGGRKVETWARQRHLTTASFNLAKDPLDAFANLNKPEDFEVSEGRALKLI